MGASTSPQLNFTALAAEIVSAYVSNNHVGVEALGGLIAGTHAALAGLSGVADGGGRAQLAVEKPTPAQIRKSVTPDALVSFLDGKPYKTLRRHLTTNGLTFEQYRERFGLPRDYPATAASYSQARSALAKSLGLGQGRRKAEAGPEPAAVVTEKPKRTSRPRKAKVLA